MRPSNTMVSDTLNELLCASLDIDASLLDGEKVTMIYEAALIYNQLRSMVTPEYFCDDEYEWLKSLGHSWNAECKHYRTAMGENLEEGHKANLDDLEDQIRDALDDLLGPKWDDYGDV